MIPVIGGVILVLIVVALIGYPLFVDPAEGPTVVREGPVQYQGNLEAEIEEEISRRRQKKPGRGVCPQCGSQLLREAQQFCHVCGAKLN